MHVKIKSQITKQKGGTQNDVCGKTFFAQKRIGAFTRGAFGKARRFSPSGVALGDGNGRAFGAEFAWTEQALRRKRWLPFKRRTRRKRTGNSERRRRKTTEPNAENSFFFINTEIRHTEDTLHTPFRISRNTFSKRARRRIYHCEYCRRAVCNLGNDRAVYYIGVFRLTARR